MDRYELFDHRRDRFQEQGVVLPQATKPGDLPRDRLLGVRAVEAGDFDYVDGRGAGREDVLGDFQIDPHPPFPAAPLAGEVAGREKGQEQPGPAQPLMEAVLPVVQGVDLVLVEEGDERTSPGELVVLGEQFLHEAADPAVAIVPAGVGDEEVVEVGVAGHTFASLSKQTGS